eukprot:TRINITY_DN4530_c0_g1_i3.p1 TRINITY_DN4530_c0_g1~~TRINITY_DN4530_c0_g1_i3.p1  ORF type:complete len:485 (+),score=157.96 TRINITY_DN4530_c0_g1_i3:89-1543(+)
MRRNLLRFQTIRRMRLLQIGNWHSIKKAGSVSNIVKSKFNTNPFRRAVVLPDESTESKEPINRDSPLALPDSPSSSSPSSPFSSSSSPVRPASTIGNTTIKSPPADAYSQQLEIASREDFSFERNCGFLYPTGNDTAGRPIITVVSERFPNGKAVDLDRLLRYVIFTMDKIVDNEYSVVLVQTSSGENGGRPGFSWLLKAYKLLTRKYKKNLKSLYIIHPTLWVKGTLRFFKPFISSKFWQKLVYIEEVNDIYKYIRKDQLKLPDFVTQFSRSSKKFVPVFGASLEEVMNRADHENHQVPIVVEKSIQYLMNTNANTVQGIFRLSGSTQTVQQLRKDFDNGLDVNLSSVDDPHVVSSLFKLFLREMAEPLFPYDAYNKLITIYRGGSDDMTGEVCNVIQDLPPANKALLRRLLELMVYIEKNAAVNQMTSSNLSIVFAPNILRAPQETMQQAILNSPIVNSIVRMIVEQNQRVFAVLKDAETGT